MCINHSDVRKYQFCFFYQDLRANTVLANQITNSQVT